VIEVSGDRPTEAPPAEAKKAWLAVETQVLTASLADRLGLKGRTGVRVTHVIDTTLPLRVGDAILAIDGQPVRATAPTDEEVFATAIRRLAIGATVNLTVSREGMELTMPVVLGVSPALAREMKRYEDSDFGFRARDIADSDRSDPRWDVRTSGVLVDNVSQGSWASLAQLAGGDVILALDDQPIAGVDDLAARLEDVKRRRPASVVLFVRRGVKTLFIDLEPAWR
jgi:S1-C subfamily serine protease